MEKNETFVGTSFIQCVMRLVGTKEASQIYPIAIIGRRQHFAISFVRITVVQPVYTLFKNVLTGSKLFNENAGPRSLGTQFFFAYIGIVIVCKILVSRKDDNGI